MRRHILFFHLSVFCVVILITQSLSTGEALGNDAESSVSDTIQVLELSTAEHIALADNPSLAAAGERVRQARERVLQAASAYWPRVDATASGSRVWLSDNGYRPDVDDPEDYYNAGLTATWVLFDGFERRFSVAAASFAEQESEEAEMNTRRLLLSSVAASYYNAQLASENIGIAEADEVFYRRQVEDAKARRRVGTGSLSDVLNFQIQVNSAKSRLIESKQAYKVAMFGLAALMGIPDAAFPSGMELARLDTESSEELVPPEPDPLIDYALAHRPDILQNGYASERAASAVGQARAKFFPTVSLSATFRGERTGSAAFESGDFGSTVGLNFSYNLFDAGADRSKLREAKLRKTEVEKSMENVRITVISEVRGAIANLKSAQKQLALQRSNAGLVRQNRDLAEKEYNAGQSSLVRLNEAQRDMITAQARLALALVSLRQAWHSLQVSTAQILARSGVQK